MRRCVVTVCSALALAAALAAPAFAFGPVNGEVGAVWWANDYETAGVSSDAGAPGFRAELWLLERYGVRAARFESDPSDFPGNNSVEYTSLDLMWKAVSPTENNFFAIGAGWEQVDLGLVGIDGSTSGARLSAEGRIGFMSVLQGYAQLSYQPSLDDTETGFFGVRLTDLEGFEYEAGVSWKALPAVSVRAGYRQNSVDYRVAVPLLPPSGGETAESSGFLVGMGLTF